jgi:hypothetical protein
VRDDVFVELIADGIHVVDALIRIVDRCAGDRVPRTQGGIDVEDRTRRAVLCQRWR